MAMSPDNRAREIQTLLEQAQTHNQQDDRPAAESCLRKVLSISPVEVNALYGLVVFSLDVSPPVDIRTLIAEQFEQQGQNPEFHFNLGKALSRAKLYAQASESFRRAASHASDPSVCYNQVGLAEESLQAFEKAAEAYQRAVQLNPTKAEIFNNLGNALSALKRMDDAQKAYRKAVELRPDVPEPQLNLAVCLKDEGQLEEALRCISRAIHLAPNLSDAHYHKAVVLQDQHRSKDALESVEECLRFNQHHQLGLALKAIILNDLGRSEEASRLVDHERLIGSIVLKRGNDNLLKAFNARLARGVLEHPSLVRDPIGASTRGGRHSADLLGEGDVFQELEKLLREAISYYVRELSVEPDHAFLRNMPSQPKLMVQANVLDSGGYLVPHVHPAGWLTGVYYVSLPGNVGADPQDRSGWLQLGRPPETINHVHPLSLRQMRPQQGMLVLFPSYFYHSTIPFVSDTPRISLGIDVLA